ncbi:MAG: peptide chain release factor N(5)-glutamine methyltransferase, partial [Mariprofundaceae bacterium]|nr:peptide chain release factor N(5)-glutamine methyltransferase [Mariprofundaceae bacterium]
MVSGSLNAEGLTQRALLQQATQSLQQVGCESPRLDAEVLWQHLSGQSRVDMIIRAHDAVSPELAQRYQTWLARRQLREPVAYITGEKEFWSRTFNVSEATLIPRPETEHIIEWALATFPDPQQNWCFADVGTGSGCIAVTLACEFPHATIIASDISVAALQVAQTNARRHGVEDRVLFVAADLLSATAAASFDAVLSNPPYVTKEEMNELKQELSYEPTEALTDHSDGLCCMR